MLGSELFGSPTLTYVAASALIFVLTWVLLRSFSGKKYPPGPYGLPIVGYLPFLTNRPYLKLCELGKKYGPVYSLKIGSRYVIVMCEFETIKEAFNQDAFFGRPPDSTFQLHPETLRIGAIQDMGYKEQRRFTLHMLRNLGFGKISMEQHMTDELHELLGEMKKRVGKPINVSDMLSPSVSNNISSLVFGKRRDFNDPERLMLDKLIRELGRLIGQATWHAFFPWARLLVQSLQTGSYGKIVRNIGRLKEYVGREVEDHKKTLQPTVARDFLDSYLMEIEKKKNQPGTTFKTPVLLDLVVAFFGAGSETARLSLDWLLLICAAKPDVQKRVQDEIDEIIGGDRFVSKSDDKQMPYTNAFIMETFRWKTLIPINVLRYTLKDTTLNSYFIPKHSYVIANLWSVHHDPRLWGDDVDEFKPERFLTKDGGLARKPEYYIPFSIGKRACPGETFAVAEIFMYITTILQKFTVRLPDGTDVQKLFDGHLGIGLQPNPYELIISARN